MFSTAKLLAVENTETFRSHLYSYPTNWYLYILLNQVIIVLP